MKLLTDLAFAQDHPLQKLDLFLPPGPGPFPVVLCIHGGGWKRGDKAGMHGYARILAADGIAAAAVNYRLATDAPHPAQEADLFSALEWIARESPKFGLDPERVGLTGSSAGAHILGLVGLKATLPGAARTRCHVRAMLPVCGVFDVPAWVRDLPSYAPNAEALVGGPLAANSRALADASPIRHVHPDAPPCLLVHGDKDPVVPVSQSLLFAEALAALGAEARCEVVAGAGHTGTHPGDPLQPLGGTQAFLGFFRTRLPSRGRRARTGVRRPASSRSR